MKQKTRVELICILIGAALLLCTLGVVGAKYITKLQEREGALRVPAFYFFSSAMTEENDPTPISVNGNKTTVTLVNAKTVEDISDADITYTLRYYVKKDGAWQLASEVSGQKLEGNVLSADTVELTPIEYGSVLYDEVMLEATSVSPYEKTLRLCVSFDYSHYQVTYSYDGESNVITAVLQTHVDEGEFEIGWIGGVSPDNADENGILNASLAGPSAVDPKPALEAMHAYVLRFFVTDPALDTAIEAAVGLGQTQEYLRDVVPIRLAE